MEPVAELLGQSAGIAAVREELSRLLAHQQRSGRLPPILLQGETGTGKGLLAHLIHREGPRRAGPFIDVNCAAIPATLLEAELFGFERGAFTDARHSKPGLFQAAHQGMLFLDEVGLLPDALQGKLLKVIENRAVRRLGTIRTEPVDVWVIAATSEDLAAGARTGRFRSDLYHRLAVVTIELPPLRNRRDDILLLAEHFLARAVSEYGLARTALAPDARAALVDYPWPGNVRELANVMERVALLTPRPVVTAANLGLAERAPSLVARFADEHRGRPAEPGMEEVEEARITEALQRMNWNVSRTAGELGMSREKLRYRMQKYALHRPPAAPGRGARRPSTPTRALAPGAMTAPWRSAAQWTHEVLAVLRASLASAGEVEASLEFSRSLEVLADKVQGFGGRVEDVSPHGLVAVFGLDGTGDVATRAALAGLAIQRLATRTRVHQPRVTGKVAIHTARLLVGQVGGSPQIAIDAKQQAAAVLEALISRADPDTVVVSGTTIPFVDRRFDVVPLDPSGAEEPRAYRLSVRGVAAGRARSTRFVGRRDELALLRARMALAAAGQAEVIDIVGEPGIGKSRLLLEFCAMLAGEPITFLAGHCVPFGNNTPYLPILEMMREACNLTDADTAEAVAEKVRLTVEASGVEAGRIIPYLLGLLGIETGRDELAMLSADAIRARTFAALRGLFLSLARRSPLVLGVEDLHWIDTTSEEFLASLVEELPGTRVLLVATYRPAYQPPWTQKAYVTEMTLSQLSAEESEGLLASIMPADPVARTVAPLIVAKAEGNPFFLEELARAVGGGVSDPPPTIPDTVQDVLLARINVLPAQTRDALQLASVCGRTIPARLLHDVWQGRASVDSHLRELVHREFLYLEDGTEDAVYTFKHSLTQEVAYQSLFEGTRRHHHQRVAEVLAERLPHVVETQPELLAHHYTEGGVGREAVASWLRAGQVARARSAYVEASNHLRKGLAVLATLPATRERADQELALQLALGGALLTASSFGAPEVAEAYTRARELCRHVAPGSRLFNALSGLEAFHTARAELRQAQELGEQCLALARELGEPSLVCRASNALGSILVHHGSPTAAAEHLREALARVSPDGGARYRSSVYHPRVFALSYQSWALWLLGRPEEACAASAEALEVAQKLSHPHSSALASHYASVLAQLRGDSAEARRQADSVIAAAIDQGFRTYLALGRMMRGWSVADRGEVEAGVELLRQGLALYHETGIAIGRPYFLGLLADAHSRVGRVREALDTLAEAIAVGNEHDEHAWDAELVRLKGEMLLAPSIGDERQARRCFEDALAVAREQHALAWELRASTSLGRLRAA